MNINRSTAKALSVETIIDHLGNILVVTILIFSLSVIE